MADLGMYRDNHGLDPGAALRALPLESPDAGAWSRVASQLPAARRARTTRRRRLALAAAAAVLLAVLAPRIAREPAPAPDAQGDLPALMAESARLERMLAAASDDVTGNASTMVLSLQIEDRVHALDAALAQPGLADGERLAHWRERVELLHAAAGLESSRRYYAAQGRALEPTLVAAY